MIYEQIYFRRFGKDISNNINLKVNNSLISDSIAHKEVKNDILFENNSGVDHLNGQPLTDGEMRQILSQVETLKSPYKLNTFINGKSVTIVRDNPNDTLHFTKLKYK